MTRPCFDNLPEKEIYANPPLRAYLTNVQRRHHYLQLLTLPDRFSRPNVPIETLFVPPLVSPRPIAVSSNPEDWPDQCESIYAALERYERVLLLGDPGMGKTSLVNRLARDLTFAPSRGPFINRFGWMLPVPMVLREIPLRGVDTFDGLLDAFLSQPVGEPLRDGDYLPSLLKEGRAFLMLDGIDELGGKDARLDLRSAVFDGMRRFPGCLWLLSSRIVGYGEVPYERRLEHSGKNGGTVLDADFPAIGKRYIAPFDDRRISRFVHNWYYVRDADAGKAGRAADLVHVIQRDPALRQLARVPGILAQMAFVHRLEAALPHERSVLYRRIADAYLASDDKDKGIGENLGDLPRKKMWLARVGYEMQCRRQHDAPSELLASCDDVLHWIGQEMERSKAFVDVPTPAEFLSFVGRRSGLFVPRGKDQYGFSHLSLQEHFAAAALEGELTGFKWAKEGRSSLGFSRTDVAAWARQPAWLETFRNQFEILADRPEWHGELLNCVFGENFGVFYEEDADEALFHLGHLAAHLVANPHSGLGPRERERALDACVRTQIRCSAHHLQKPDAHDDYVTDSSILAFLAHDRDSCDKVFASLRRQWAEATVDLEHKVIDLRGAVLEDLRHLELAGLEVLILTDTAVRSANCVRKFKEVSWLELDGTPVEDISPLADMPKLEFLNLERTNVEDITPLARLPSLRAVLLSDTPISSEAVDALRQALPHGDVLKER